MVLNLCNNSTCSLHSLLLCICENISSSCQCASCWYHCYSRYWFENYYHRPVYYRKHAIL